MTERSCTLWFYKNYICINYSVCSPKFRLLFHIIRRSNELTTTSFLQCGFFSGAVDGLSCFPFIYCDYALNPSFLGQNKDRIYPRTHLIPHQSLHSRYYTSKSLPDPTWFHHQSQLHFPSPPLFPPVFIHWSALLSTPIISCPSIITCTRRRCNACAFTPSHPTIQETKQIITDEPRIRMLKDDKSSPLTVIREANRHLWKTSIFHGPNLDVVPMVRFEFDCWFVPPVYSIN